MSKQYLSVLNGDGVLLTGYYKKLKTMKKKFFVLYNETPCKVARIEYYDNEKKYNSGFTPKRIIKIKNCFNINRRLHTKHDFVIVLASKDGGFGIVMDSEDDMNTWLNHLLHLQRSGESCFDFPKFDYVWQVLIQKKGIAEQHNIFGSHHLCLTNKSVTFIKIGREKNAGEKNICKIDVFLTTIRRCGDSQCYFYMEIGRQNSLGPGELWMETEDSLTAQNMHKMILSKMVSLNEALNEPMRKRSSSATEASTSYHDGKPAQKFDSASNCLPNALNFNRDRCDSLPSRNRTSSECSNRIIRIIPNHSDTTPVAYSSSQASASADHYKEGTGIPFLKRTHFSTQTCLLGSKCEYDITKDALPNRVRAFSVGSRIKSSRTCSKASHKLFNSDSVDCSTRKSISVPVLINKNTQSADQMGDLMEIDFSKCIDRTLNRNFLQFKKDCQNLSNIPPRNLGVSNSEESLQISMKKTDNGYLEMKPITLDAHSMTSTENNPLNNGSTHSQNRYKIEKCQKTNSTAYDDTSNDRIAVYDLKETNYSILNDQNNKDAKIKSITSTSLYISNHSEDINLSQQDITDLNKDLYYASLDLPKCGDEVNNRYGFQEKIGDTNIEGIKNDYAKINFVLPDISQSLPMKKY